MPDRLATVLVDAPLAAVAGALRSAPVGPGSVTVEATAAGVLVTAEVAASARAVAAEAVRLRDAPEVVAGAVLRDGRLLLARRTWPVALAGRWELPGGGVEPGESSAAALARELDEELGITVRVGEQLGVDVALPGGRVLRARWAELVDGEPQLREHSELRWVDGAELGTVDLVPADRAWTAALRERLS